MRSLPHSALLLVLLACAAPGLTAQTVLHTTGGTTDSEALGTVVAAGGDADADGAPDVALGAPAYDAGGGTDQGRAVVISGTDGSVLFSQVGAAVGDRFGAALALAGDTNLDGQADVAVGAPGVTSGQGQVVVHSGATSGVLLTLDGTAAGDGFGTAVAFLADLNADGRDDIAVGAPDFDGVAGMDTGRVTVHSGLDGTVLWAVEGTNAGDRLGAALAPMGDLDDDGDADLVVGIPGFDGTAGADAGRVVVLSGATQLELLAAEGTQAGVAFGSVVAAGGDLDNDARRDVLVGVPLFDGGAGVDSGRVVALSGRDQSELFSLEGANADDRLGAAVAGGRDADADGIADLVVGAPNFDGVAGADTGRIALLSGADQSELFGLEGDVAGDAEGSAAALLGTVTDDTRADFVSAAPLADGAGSDRGLVTVLSWDTPSTDKSASYDAPSLPRDVTLCDADGDGDLDAVVVGDTTVSILWNTDRTSTTPTGALNGATRTDVTLTGGATGVSVAAGQLDVDLACELVVGRSDGTVDVIDGTGSLGTSAFALSGTSPITVDGTASPGAIAGVAVLGSGATASVICAGAGSLVFSGFLDEIVDPLGSPSLTGQFVSGGSFSDVVIADLDGDTNDDVIAANSSSGGFGGVHVLLGPGLTAATGSPFSAGTPPVRVTVADLDGNGMTDDVAIASLSLTGGGVRVLGDFVVLSGFNPPVDPGLTLARDLTTFSRDADANQDLAVLDGDGDVIALSGWNGSAFATQETLPSHASAGVALVGGQLTPGPTPDDTEEIVTVHLATDLVTTWCGRRLFAVTPVPNTGCPPGSPTATASLTGDPVLNGTSLRIRLAGASPLSLCFLVAQENLPTGSMPTVDTGSGCGVAMSTGDLNQFFGYTDALGAMSLPAGLPTDPGLVGSEYLLQWAILDGGPLLGTLSVSDAIVVRIGEP